MRYQKNRGWIRGVVPRPSRHPHRRLHRRNAVGITLCQRAQLELTPVGVPDGPWRLVVPPFAPYRMSRALIVDREAEIVSKGKAEAAGKNVVVALRWTREARLSAPRGAAVGRTAVERVP